MKIVGRQISSLGKAVKYQQMVDDKWLTETAYINDGRKHIICFASQLGCQVACKICFNGLYPNFYGNLDAAQIVRQCSNIAEDMNLSASGRQIIFSCMGIGEPFHNYDNVMSAMLALDAKYPGNKFAMSTTMPRTDLIKRLAADTRSLDSFKLMVSLHGSNDAQRKKIIPAHESMSALRDAVDYYACNTPHSYEWNYVLIAGVNDKDKHAKELAGFMAPGDFIKISAFNAIPGSSFKNSDKADRFKELLDRAGIRCETFVPDGADIGGSCGQMAAQIINSNQK